MAPGEPGRLGWLDLGLGVAVAAVVAGLVGLQILVVPHFAAIFRDFDVALPQATRLVLSGVLPLGAVGVALGLGAGGLTARARGAGPVGAALLVGGALTGAGAAAFSVYALYLPMFQLAGTIRP